MIAAGDAAIVSPGALAQGEVAQVNASGAERVDSQLAPTNVSASAIGDTSPAQGGQVARGGRVGLLGDKGVMETLFSVTHYTSERITDQQAVTLAEVLNADPSARFTGQIDGVTDSFFIRGLLSRRSPQRG